MTCAASIAIPLWLLGGAGGCNSAMSTPTPTDIAQLGILPKGRRPLAAETMVPMVPRLTVEISGAQIRVIASDLPTGTSIERFDISAVRGDGKRPGALEVALARWKQGAFAGVADLTVTVVQHGTEKYQDVIAALDSAERAGFDDVGLGDVPAPAK